MFSPEQLSNSEQYSRTSAGRLRDRKGEGYSVRDEAVKAMLLNAFLKAHRRIKGQDKRFDQLTAPLKLQAALIQKVSDKVELNKPRRRVVANDSR